MSEVLAQPVLVPDPFAAWRSAEVEDIETELLLEGIYRRYGYDFRLYAPSSLRRRLHRCLLREQCTTHLGLLERLMRDTDCMQRVLVDLTVSVTSMFRDPSFYVALREKVVPLLRSYPLARIWVAGCASGEEAYSTAILLAEEGLSGRARIYATDLNAGVITRAKTCAVASDKMAEFAANHARTGGHAPLERWFTIEGDYATLIPEVARTLVFAQHDLVSDSSFNEFNLILCRNVMIYFGKALQRDVHHLLYDSLAPLGVLALGRQESIRFTSREDCYDTLDGTEKLYRKLA